MIRAARYSYFSSLNGRAAEAFFVEKQPTDPSIKFRVVRTDGDSNIVKITHINTKRPSTGSEHGVVIMPNPTEVELNAKLEAVEARTDTKIVRLEGKLDLVLEAVRSTKEEGRDNRRAVIANLWVIFGALVVLIGIIVTVAPVIFDLGSKFRETVTKEIQEQIKRLPNVQQ